MAGGSDPDTKATPGATDVDTKAELGSEGGVGTAVEEKRFDGDGKAYTFSDFVKYYGEEGGKVKWDAAAALGNASAAPITSASIEETHLDNWGEPTDEKFSDQWYYLGQDSALGPFTLEQMKGWVRGNYFPAATLVAPYIEGKVPSQKDGTYRSISDIFGETYKTTAFLSEDEYKALGAGGDGGATAPPRKKLKSQTWLEKAMTEIKDEDAQHCYVNTTGARRSRLKLLHD